ncbi:MAG: carboxylating nicotinate-nucleotide diphosphorylase [Bacteroidota bacterium]
MHLSYLTEEALTSFITTALQEDVGDGDHTTLASIPAEAKETAEIVLKDSGVVAGVEMAKRIFLQVSQELSVTTLVEEGAWVVTGTVVMRVSGPARAILTAERLVLNCMQRMSGIATYTRQLTDLIQGTHAKLLDTRKTTPNFRICEKWAVAIGGGVNHRYGLWDMILLKDNHVDYAGSITEAVRATQKYLQDEGKDLKIEVETRTLQEVQEALEVGGVFRIMLDNMQPDTMRQAIILIDGKAQTEASGGINERTIRVVAETGVDYISVGALTHSFKSLDLSLKAVKS